MYVQNDSNKASKTSTAEPKQDLTEIGKQRTGTGRISRAQQSLNARGISWPQFLAAAAFTSVTFGSFIQVTHNNGLLPKYDVWDFKLGPTLQSGLVPLLLLPIWLLYSYLQVLLDEVAGDDVATQRAVARARSPAYVLLNWGVIAAGFLLSSFMYLAQYPYWLTSAILAGLAVANWKAFDGTRQGIFLGVLLAIGAPLTEAAIVNFTPLWHYDRPDFLGVTHFSAWCYAQYAWGVGNFGRCLFQRMAKGSKQIKEE